MSEYPRELLITEDVIREFEEVVGVRFINKTECAKALKAHDAEIKAEAIDEVKEAFEEHMFNSPLMNPFMMRNEILLLLEQLKEKNNG